MNHQLANSMKLWRELEILNQERRGQVKTIVMEHLTGILFHKSGPANKQHTNQVKKKTYKTMIIYQLMKSVTTKDSETTT